MSQITIPTKVHGLTELAQQLTVAKLTTKQGEGRLFVSSVVAMAISTALALTVAGGTWMFYQRWQEPYGILLEMLAWDPTFDALLIGYFILAIFACSLLISPVVSLAASSAVLGARGRERRLAVLRLVGLSSSDVTRISLYETMLQTIIGSAIGIGLYFLTLPAWQLMEFQAMPIQFSEMLLPWWLMSIVILATAFIALAASWWGLKRVRITPLGVARRGVAPALTYWRLIIFALLMLLWFIGPGVLEILNIKTKYYSEYLLMGIFLWVAISAYAIIGPFVLQLVSRVIAQSSSPTIMWAARRIQAFPKATWSRISGMSLLAIIGGFMTGSPITVSGPNNEPGVETTFLQATVWDFSKGAFITLAIGFLLTATATFISQAAEIYERAEQSQALAKMGASHRFIISVGWWQTLGPLAVAMVISSIFGYLIGTPLRLQASNMLATMDTATMVYLVIMALGFVTTICALLLTNPLQREVLTRHSRRND